MQTKAEWLETMKPNIVASLKRQEGFSLAGRDDRSKLMVVFSPDYQNNKGLKVNRVEQGYRVYEALQTEPDWSKVGRHQS